MKEMTSYTSKRWGMIQYTILEDGNLQGIWTHSDKIGDSPTNARQLFTEIARKEDIANEGAASRTALTGRYRVAWVDEAPDNGVLQTLTITQNGTVYTFKWRTDARISFTGVGMRLGPTSLVVTFWPGDDDTYTLMAR